MRICRTL